MLRPILELRRKIGLEAVYHEPIVISSESEDDRYHDNEAVESSENASDESDYDSSFINDEDSNDNFNPNEHLSDKNLDFYTLLGVHKNASPRDIKIAYHKMALIYHPDKSDDPRAGEMMSIINRAYGILSNPKLRKKYGKYISNQIF